VAASGTVATDRPSPRRPRDSTRFLAHQPASADVFYFDKAIVDLGRLDV
jgi:hypothetical protein